MAARPSQTSGRVEATIKREGTIKEFSILLVPGITILYAPAKGKAVQVLAWNFSCDAAFVCELRFSTSQTLIAGLPGVGISAMNTVGNTPPQGAVDETVEMYVSGAANVKGWINVKEV